MSDDIISLIMVLSWWFLYVINHYKIHKLNDRIKKLEEQVKEYNAPILRAIQMMQDISSKGSDKD